jgi:hypothetical protein
MLLERCRAAGFVVAGGEIPGTRFAIETARWNFVAAREEACVRHDQSV